MNSKGSQKFSLKKRVLSFKYAFQGIFTALKSQHNFQIHIIAAVIVIAAGFILDVSKMEWIILTLCIATVIAAELFNSSIEELTDMVSPEKNEKAGKVKDIAAGAVLVTAIAAAIIGLLIFLPKILERSEI